MSDLTLLIFGAAVTFIALAGAYVYLRESFMAAERAEAAVVTRPEPLRSELRDVA